MAKQAEERAIYAANVRAAQGARSTNMNSELEQARARLLKEFEARREALIAELKNLEENQRRVLADLERKAAIVRQNSPRQTEAAGAPPSAGKLDQILDRLERIELRLERLERNQKGQ